MKDRDGLAWVHQVNDRRKSAKDVYLEKKGFSLGETIGSGAYAKVKRAYDRVNKREVAIKIVDKCNAPSDYLMKFFPRELEYLRYLKHPNLVDLLGLLESSFHYFVVLELVDGGDLLDYIRCHKIIAENTARHFFKQLCCGMQYCHQRDVVHRDLKCENVLLTTRGQVKICDFGFATKYDRGRLLSTFCGSCAYASPEILQGRRYDGFKADVWSVGVVLYAMIYGCLPYDDANLKLQITQIHSPKYPKYKSVERRKEPISQKLLDLLRRMLTIAYKDRPDSLAVLRSPWLMEHKKKTQSKIQKSFSFPNQKPSSTESSLPPSSSNVPSESLPAAVLDKTRGLASRLGQLQCPTVASKPGSIVACSPIITPLFPPAPDQNKPDTPAITYLPPVYSRQAQFQMATGGFPRRKRKSKMANVFHVSEKEKLQQNRK
eukprot:m.38929 g.38929  ORF g.38929 m.38929 type:complete len:432 (+) comp32647_c0_seq2:64-1359(+)